MSGEPFNNPFSGLPPPAAARRKTAKKPPAGLSPDVGLNAAASDARRLRAEDEAALFMEAMGKTPMRKKSDPDDGLQSLAEFFSAQNPAQGVSPEAADAADSRLTAGKSSGVKRSERAGELPEAELSADEASSFALAMQGVRLVNESRGRALTPAAARPPARINAAGRDYLAEFTQGKYEFALEYTEEFFEGHVLGLDPLALAKMRAGQYSAETHIDLHGLNAEQAYGELVTFVKSAYSHDYRHLLVVTGRGKNSPGGLSVLRQNMQEWLTKEPLRRVVLAFCTAQPKDGGAGALYVLLRKYKKSQGKVRWDITPPGV